MSNLDILLGIRSPIADSIALRNDPDGLFPNATADDIGRDPELTNFLLNSLELSKDTSPNLLAERVFSEAKKDRGGTFFELLGVPAIMPKSIRDHQFLNLFERLYLSSLYGTSKPRRFAANMISRESRDTRILIGSTGSMGMAVGIALLAFRLRSKRMKALGTSSEP